MNEMKQTDDVSSEVVSPVMELGRMTEETKGGTTGPIIEQGGWPFSWF